MSKRIHVVPHESGWATRREGAARAGSTHHTQAEATEAARNTALREHAKSSSTLMVVSGTLTRTATTPSRRKDNGRRLQAVRLRGDPAITRGPSSMSESQPWRHGNQPRDPFGRSA
jgi:hypothetical protein